MLGTKQRPEVARVREQDREYCVATWQRTVFAIFRGEATLANIGTISKVCLAELAAGAGPVTYVGVIERSSPAPSETVRKELANWSRDIVPRMACSVMVAEGGGNHLIAESLQRLHIHVHIFRSCFRSEIAAEAVHEHDAVIAALRSRSGASAEAAMRRHIERSYGRLRDFIKE